MQNLIITICGTLLFTAGFAQEESTSRKWFLGRGAKSQEQTALAQSPAKPVAVAQDAAAASGSAATTAPKSQGAHFDMPEPTYNFGDVPRKGGDLIHDFVFTNNGSTPLVVTRVITSCSCLKASFPKRPIVPGDSGVIRITYEPHKSEPGAFNKVIQIFSNSVDGRDVITVQGNSIDGDSGLKVKVDGTKIKIK